jgi:hypothetical protein
MATPSRASQTGSGATAKILMVVALVAILGLMFYLNVASKASVPPPMPTDDSAGSETAGSATAPAVTAADFGANAQSYVGQEIDLRGVSVSQVMSPEIIWIDVPTPQGNTPFLVKVLSGSAPAQNAKVNIEGRILEKTDSVIAAWQQSGAIQNAGQKDQAEYGSLFIDARIIRPSGS